MYVHFHGSSHNTVYFYALVGGPFWLTGAMRTWLKKRTIENTPRSKIRSAAMGVVELAGQARALKPLHAPLSGLDCCWWLTEFQELRQTGRSSVWVTTMTTASNQLFYLEDETGRILIDPLNAEMQGMRKSTFSQGARSRAIEQCILEGGPLFAMGYLGPTNDAYADTRRQRMTEWLQRLKADKEQMAQADANRDGVIDAQEWDAFREKKQRAFLAAESAFDAEQPTAPLVLRRPPHGTYLIAAETEKELLRGYAWSAPLGILGGLTATALGAWVAMLDSVPSSIIVGIVLGSFGLAWVFRPVLTFLLQTFI